VLNRDDAERKLKIAKAALKRAEAERDWLRKQLTQAQTELDKHERLAQVRSRGGRRDAT
jgi:multidrug resistance efflux pump